MQQDYIMCETAVCIKMLLRKYPAQYHDLVDKLKTVMRSLEENAGKCAVLWVLGEYGDRLIEAPYILESYIDGYDMEDSSEVKLEMLAAAMKLFFKKAPEVQRMLGRLLKYDVAKAEAVVRCPKVSVNSFVDPGEEDLTDKIFDEFNTLSVIYKKPAELFITDEGIEDSDDDKDDYDEDEDAEDEGIEDSDDDKDDYDEDEDA